MDKIYTKTRAKINLTLNILNKRDDGYHNLESVFQKINLYDELYIEKNTSNLMTIDCTKPELNGECNLIYKAYIKLKQKYPIISGINIKLLKKIPMQAGLGGGSADCAGFLLAMNKLFDLNMNMYDLIDIGKTLGADVPACLFKSAVKGEGIGEIITKINTKLKYYLVIIKPEISCSTGAMFQVLDNSNITQKYNTDIVIQALEANNLQLLADNLYNVFEEILIDEVKDVKNNLIANGALASLLSGSGSCVFGIFENKDTAKKAYDILKKNYETYICTTMS